MKKLALMIVPFLVGPLQAAEIPVWNLGAEEPHFYLNLQDSYNQKASYTTVAGRKALKLDFTQSNHVFCYGWFRSYRILPDFSRAVLKVPYYLPAGCETTEIDIILCDRTNEQFPVRIGSDRTPGWHVAEIPLDAESEQRMVWDSAIRTVREGQNVVTGRPKFYDQPMRVIGVRSYSTKVGTPSSWFALGPITLDVRESSRAIRPVLETGTPIHVLKKGEEAKLGFTFFNPAPQPYRGKVVCKMSDACGKPVKDYTFDLDLAPDAKQFVKLDVPKEFGNYDLAVESTSPGKKTCELHQSFSYMDPVGATPGVRATGFLFGIDTHFPQWRTEAETEAEALALCGAKIVRENTCWLLSQPTRDTPLSFALNDDPLEPFEKLGVEWQPTLLFPPKWAISENTHANCPDYGDWREYCRAFFMHTKGRVRFYEVWNEADIDAGLPWEKYIELQRIACEELKKIDPAAYLLTCGYAFQPGGEATPARPDPKHMEKTVRDIKSYDILAYHDHSPYPRFFKGNTENVVKLLARYAPGKHFYNNETALTVVYSKTEYEQGVQLFKKLIFAWANGSIGYTWYDLRDDGFDPAYTEHNYGMMTRDFYPKPVYVVFNTLAKRLTGAKFIREMSKAALQGYLFRAGNGDWYYAFWTLGTLQGDTFWTPAPKVNVQVKRIRGQASLVDQYGNETPLPVKNGTVSLEAGETPFFLRITGGGMPTL